MWFEQDTPHDGLHRIAVTRNADGGLETFAVTPNGDLWHLIMGGARGNK